MNQILKTLSIIVVSAIVSYTAIYFFMPIGGGATGVALPQAVAVFETSLQSPISSSATSMTLTANAIRGGGSLSGYNCFTVDEGSTNAETICGTVASTAVSSLARGISQENGTTTVSALQFSHRRGANVKITDFPIIQRLKAQNAGQDTFVNPLVYSTDLTFTDNKHLISKKYADDLTNQGAATSTESNGGIVELATNKEVASSTATTAIKPLVIQAQNATSTPTYGCNGTGVVGELCVVVSEYGGKLNQLWIDLTEAFIWTGAHTFNSTVDIEADAGANVTFNGVAYEFPSSTGNANEIWKTNGSGVLSFSVDRATGYNLASNADLAISTTVATTSVLAVPANVMTASSTIEVSLTVVCADGGTDGVCNFALRDNAGAEFIQCTGFVGTNGTNKTGTAVIKVMNDNATNSQISTCTGMSTDETIVKFIAVESTSSIDTSVALNLVVIYESTNQTTGTVNNFMIEVNP